ncbi:MAG TPA: alpha-glucan family phosphorylase [Bacteroidales bacterium]|nr:alpha-glucan family phosphorylase [Bacteroidales bacterium]
MSTNGLRPNYLFEVSWEVCNKMGGIYTSLSTKAQTLINDLHSNYILIGPDVWRDTQDNPEFEEDRKLFKAWKVQAAREGLRIRTGRWKIKGSPVVIIIDFTTFITQKDNIFSDFWEQYKLDSISGQWDYIEPSLFGYASGKVIESFTRFYLSSREKVVAQFHEWMTGTGLLYLRQAAPGIATVFTAHATVIGRSIAIDNLPLYDQLKNYNANHKALDYNVVSKQSLEKLSAGTADCFTTLSGITARECVQFLKRDPDLLTPNGFDNSIVPQNGLLEEKRKSVRQLLISLAESLTGEKPDDDVLITGISGRYEFRNKGIDVFIDALGQLDQLKNEDRQVLAFLFIPANNYGARKDLLNAIGENNGQSLPEPYFTHNLHDLELDPVISGIKANGLTNKPGDKVKVIFVPAFMNGSDGIFNLPYYDLLTGLDITIFPSYYDPWGFTPMESIAFHVPTVTTSLTGFGQWISDEIEDPGHAAVVINRSDNSTDEASLEIATILKSFAALSPKEREEIRKKAASISEFTLWKYQIDAYFQAYNLALEQVVQRSGHFKEPERAEQIPHEEKFRITNKPIWKKIVVEKYIPEKLAALEALAKNLWWSWNYDAIELFRSIDPVMWADSEENPVVFLENIPYRRYMELEADQAFINNLEKVHHRFNDYMKEGDHRKPPRIAYFSMEFGLHDSLKIYSGGLGILAGDYLKEASDYNYDIVGVGLLYRYGYFKQQVSGSGEQIVSYEAQQFSKTPAQPVRDKYGNVRTIGVVFPGRTLYAQIWKVSIGRVTLYLLDTDFDENMEQDRYITHHLYGGDNENRLKQELLLGIGGIRALHTLEIERDIYHCNEGHAAFIGLERMREYITEDNLTFSEALEVVRSSTLFTTHTPVPAGHDYFTEDLMRMYLSHYPARLKINWDQFLNLGKIHPNDSSERFSMSYLAANLSQEMNGVSRLHGKVSQQIFDDLWPGYTPDELHIGYVTNGVHIPTWISEEMLKLYNEELSPGFLTEQENISMWQKIKEVPDKKIWSLKSQQREKFIEYIKQRMREAAIRRLENPRLMLEIEEKLNKDTLTIGFARRFATYKRAHLLFRDPERLARIMNNPEMPVQFVFAGKAHPQDKGGQDLIKMVVEMSHRPEFLGKIIFLQNYEISLAQKLVQGVDIWLNTPTRPLEASGTSGEKAVMNGALHFSVLDGWWAEGYREGAGWALSDARAYENQDFQDELDAETIYSLLENEICPLFYKRGKDDVPADWVGIIKNSIADVAPHFTMNRMLRDYNSKYYHKMYERCQKVKKDDYLLARDLVAWKKKIYRAWEHVEVLSANYPEITGGPIQIGKNYRAEVVMDLGELTPDDIGVELVSADSETNLNTLDIVGKQDFNLIDLTERQATYRIEFSPTVPGVLEIGIRIYPKHPELPHRQDFGIIRWI